MYPKCGCPMECRVCNTLAARKNSQKNLNTLGYLQDASLLIEYVKRDIRNAKFLKSFQLEECSEAALALLQDFMERVALLDFKIKVLLDEMKKGWLHKEQIGESEYVDGKISAVFVSNLLYIHLDVVLPKDCPEPLGRDIYGRAYRHVKKWFDQGHGPKGGTVSLAVHGGKDALKLSVTILG